LIPPANKTAIEENPEAPARLMPLGTEWIYFFGFRVAQFFCYHLETREGLILLGHAFVAGLTLYEAFRRTFSLTPYPWPIMMPRQLITG
jgi:hypothetical protein